MQNQVGTLIFAWLAREPVAGLLLIVTAFLIFAAAFSVRRDRFAGPWSWVRALVEALTSALLFVGLAGSFYYLLSSNYAAFSRIYGSFTTAGSLSRAGWLDWQRQYGSSLTQNDLLVTQFVRKQILETVTPEAAAAPTLYRNAYVEEPVSENSISAFDGDVTIRLIDSLHLNARYNAYELTADYKYDVINSMDFATRAEFRFPLPDIRLLRDLYVQMDGEEVPSWHSDSGAMVWESRLEPGQSARIEIRYAARGMDDFTFHVSAARQVTNFKLRVVLDTDNC